MSEELKKFVVEVETLRDAVSKARDELDKPGELTSADLDKCQKDVDTLLEQHKKLSLSIVNPVKSVLKDIPFYVQNIEMGLGKIERGIDNTGEIKQDVEKIAEIFKKFEDVKDNLKKAGNAIEEMDSDIHEERTKTKTADMNIRGIVGLAMKKVKQSKAS